MTNMDAPKACDGGRICDKSSLRSPYLTCPEGIIQTIKII